MTPTVLIVIAVLIFIPAFYSLLTGKYRNPYKLYLVFGKKGSGKSTYLCKLALKYIKKGWNVYTNMDDISIPGVRLIDIQTLGDYVPTADSVLLVDEVGMIWDSRDFKKFKPAVRDFFKYQRHYQTIVYLASQTFDVDKKIRDLTDGMFLHLNILNVFSLGKRIYKKIVLTESTSEAESRISENLSFAPIWNWTLTYIPKYIKYFDSFALPELPELPYRAVLSTNVKENIRQNLSVDDSEDAEKPGLFQRFASFTSSTFGKIFILPNYCMFCQLKSEPLPCTIIAGVRNVFRSFAALLPAVGQAMAECSLSWRLFYGLSQ